MVQGRMDEIGKGVINSSRYSVKDSPFGRGCWGVVYPARDERLEQDVAIKILDPTDIAKEQMVKRQLDLFRAIEKEGGKLAACSNVVPRRLEFDDDNTPFLVMPQYEEFLDTRIHQIDREGDKDRKLEKILNGARGIAKGISEMHQKLKRAHGDLKPDNIAIDDTTGEYLLNDLGTSTCISAIDSNSPRDNMGCVYTRAPECFKKDSRPTKRSDVWAFGSLLYRMFSGRYILQEEMDSEETPGEIFSKYGPKTLNKIVRRKIKKNIPRELRKLVSKCLETSPEERYINGNYLERELEKVISKYESRSVRRRKNLSLVGLGILAAILVTAPFILQYERKAESLEKSVLETKEDLTTQKKLRAVTLFEKSYYPREAEDSSVPYDDKMEFGEIKGWRDKFGDRMTAYMAYFDTNTTYRLIQKAGGRTDYKTLEPLLRDSENLELYAKMISLSNMDDALLRELTRTKYSDVETKGMLQLAYSWT